MIEFQPLGPLWLEILTFTVAAAAFGFSVFATRHQATPVRFLVGGLRLVLLSFALLLLHHPTWTNQTTLPGEERLAVLVDRSGSMGADSDNGKTRYEKAFEMVGALESSDAKIDVYEFDQILSDKLGTNPVPRKLSGNKTDFHSAITQLLTDHSEYNGILVLSDGHDLGKFSQMSTDETKQWLERLGSPPINTVLTGNQLSGPEIAIHSIDAPSFSFVRAPLRIRATVIVRNLDNHQTQVQLLDGDQVIKIKDLVLDDQGFGTVEFEYYPESEGEHLFTVMVPAHHLETNVENNRQQVLIDIGRDKISVLHIAGSITWDLQGLRAMFEREPLVDLTAFYIMRTRDHIQQGVDNRLIHHDEMALVPFPTEEIFDRQLFSFDVVVFHDFDSGTYFSDSYQARRLYKKIREFVTKHRGGFIVVGGARTAGGPSLGLTPLADILPLVPPIQRLAFKDEPFEPVLTELGKRHPILRDFDPSIQIYDGVMQNLTENKQSSVLVRDKNKKPLLATAEVGNGRTLFLNTSSSWKWRRDALAAGKTGESYYDFWEQALKWAIGDPALNQVRITATKTSSNPLVVDVALTLRNLHYEPADSVNSALLVTPLDKKDDTIEVPFTTNSEGQAQLQFSASRPGYYRMTPRDTPWKDLSRPHTVFLGGSQDELRNLDLVPETLQRLAAWSGGKFADSTKAFQPGNLSRGAVKQQTVVETRRLKLRNWIWCLPLMLLIAAIEWWVRRSSHLA